MWRWSQGPIPGGEASWDASSTTEALGCALSLVTSSSVSLSRTQCARLSLQMKPMAVLKAFGAAAVADGFAPPENVIFLTNELLSRRGVDQRSTPRILYGTSVAFREAGRDEDEIGFSYNVSAEGLYVRTLASPEAGHQVWLEMWPPRSERRVRLFGTVAWKRPFGANEGATVPAGFGVRITEGLGGDMERWRAGYEAFAQSMFGEA